MSDDRHHAITIILFIGSVFSPYYFRARQRQDGGAHDHNAMNVALYSGKQSRWVFSEYAAAQTHAARGSLGLGANLASWNGSELKIVIDERAAPVPSCVRGLVRLHPEILIGEPIDLDPAQLHQWAPIAPRARVEVEFEHPRLRWSGNAYLDTNRGNVALEDSFSEWTWARAEWRDGARIQYELANVPDTSTGTRTGTSLSLHIDRTGQVHQLPQVPRYELPRTAWRIRRRIRCDECQPRVIQTLEDAPFYARSLVEMQLQGESVTAFHESLSLERFRSAWVRRLLPFRMRRVRA